MSHENNVLLNQLSLVLANTYQLLLLNQHLHWNYTGEDFYALHKLTDGHVGELVEQIDLLAEHMRTKMYHVPVGLSVYEKLSNITIEDHGLQTRSEYLKSLITGYEKTIDAMNDLCVIAEEEQDFATADLGGTGLRFYDKHLWMLRSSLS
ncbi:MAG: ferritin-like domain-containing protein [Pseudomonadota bacterium]|nr:ferritin-like domain-containing protein [Pseudomonadota bacterium]